MNPLDWNRLQEIAGDALDLNAVEREVYLDRVCGTDLELRRSVVALIQASDDAEKFFDAGLAGIAHELLENITPDPASPEPPRAQVRGLPVNTGQRLGRYEVTGVLGSGGMGDTFSAVDCELNRPVALKFLHLRADSGSSDGPGTAERQIREARAASALNHPNIVTVHEVLRSEHGVAIVMELVAGDVLRTRCSQPQNIELVLRIGEQMADALAAAAAAHIVHRDIKPENVMLRPDGYIKLLDFGVAKRLDASNLSHPGLPAGSFRYMSPEQSRGEKLTPATDVFSMAIVLFELASGTHPYSAKTALQAIMAISTEEPKALTELTTGAPTQLSQLLQQMMAKNPSARPSAREVAQRLRAIRGDISDAGRRHWPLQAPSTPAAGARRNWLPAALLALALAAGIWWVVAGRWDAGHLHSEMLDTLPLISGASQASISSDRRHVAFESQVGRHWLVRVLDMNTGSIETVSNPTIDSFNPVWSPDGKTIAYLRSAELEQAQIILWHLASRVEHEVGVIGTQVIDRRGSLAWSRNPDFLIVSTNMTSQDSLGLFLFSLKNGELRRLTTPPAIGDPFGDRAPAVSPDGRWLTFARILADGLADLYLLHLDPLSTPIGEPKKLETGHPWNTAPAWSASGKELIFSTGTYDRQQLVRMSAFEHDTPKPLPVPVQGSATWPAVGKNPSGKSLLLFTSSLNISILWETNLRQTHTPPKQLTSPSRRDFQPNYDPSGRRFAFVSDRSGYPEVWVGDTAGTNPVQWTDIRCSKVALPRWSPAGNMITFSAVCAGAGNIYTLSGPGAQPKMITNSAGLNENSRWLPGGGWIFFTSFRSGVSMTWKVPEAGGQMVPLTPRMTSNPQITPDGRTLFFTRLSEGTLTLWKTPLGSPADEDLVFRNIGDYLVRASGIYFTSPGLGAENKVQYFSFATGRVSTVLNLPSGITYIFDVSADEKKIIYGCDYLAKEELMKVEDF